MTNSYRKFAQQIGLVGITNLITSFSGLITLPIVSKTLGAEGYGIWGQLTIILTLLQPLITMGLPMAMVRFLAAEKSLQVIRERFTSILVFVLITSIIAAIILVLLSDIIGNAFLEGNGNLVRLVAIAIPFQVIMLVFVSYFRTFRQMKRWAAISILDVYGQAGFIAWFVLSGYGLTGLVYALIAIKGGLCFLAAIIVIPRLRLTYPRFTGFKEQLSFGVPTIPHLVSSWIVEASDRWIIGIFLGAAYVGYYTAPYTLGEFLRMFYFPLGLLLPPILSKLYDQGDFSGVKTHLHYAFKYFLLLSIPAAVGLSLLARPLLTTLSTTEIAAGGAYITPIISAGIVLHGLSAIFLQIILLVKKTRIIAVSWILAAVLNLGLNIALIPTFGITVAAVTTVIAFAFVLAITVYFSTRELTFPIDYKSIVKSLLASAIMGLVVYFVNPQSMFTAIPMAIAGVIIYFTVLFLLRGFSRAELEFFKGITKKR